MKLDIDKICDVKYLESLLSDIQNKINGLQNNLITRCDFEQIMSMNDEGIKDLFGKFSIDSKNIFGYRNFTKSNIWAKSIQNVKSKILEEIQRLNNKIEEFNVLVNEEITKLKEDYDFIKSITLIIETDDIVLDEKLDELAGLIINSKLSDEDKIKLSNLLFKFLTEHNLKSREKQNVIKRFNENLEDVHNFIDSQEENVQSIDDLLNDSKYADLIKEYYEKYASLLLECGYGNELTELLYLYSEDEHLNFNYINKNLYISKGNFCEYVIYFICMLKNVSDDFENIKNEIEKLNIMYDEYLKLEEEIEDLLAKMYKFIETDEGNEWLVNSIYELINILENDIISAEGINYIKKEYESLVGNSLEINMFIEDLKKLENELKEKIREYSQNNYNDDNFSEIYNYLSVLIDKLNYIEEKAKNGDINYEEFKSIALEIDNFGKTSVNFVDYEKDKTINLNGFVLFDYGEDGIPYIINDLDSSNNKCLIDLSIDSKKREEGYKDFEKLISDILLHGNIEKLINKDSHGNNMNRLIEPVYKKDGKGRILRNMENATGMWRLRPNLSSVCRFIEQRVVLEKGTKIFEQVVNIIKEQLPGVNFNSDSLELYINFSTCMKRDDHDGYDIARNRYNKRSPLHKMFLSDTKELLSNDECELLRDIVKMSLDAYYELSKKCHLNFDIIEKNGGVKKNGL